MTEIQVIFNYNKNAITKLQIILKFETIRLEIDIYIMTEIQYNINIEGGKTMKNIDKLIRKARESKGITQQQLASDIGISRSYVADIEAGRYIPSSEKLISLAEYLDIDLNLLKNDGNTSINN